MVFGSHEIVLDLAASMLARIDVRARLSCSNVGSRPGLVALRDSLCHLAGCVCSIPLRASTRFVQFVRFSLAATWQSSDWFIANRA